MVGIAGSTPAAVSNRCTIVAKSYFNYPRHANSAICVLYIEILVKIQKALRTNCGQKGGADVFFRALPLYAIVAQLVEQPTCNRQVAGSIPVGSSITTANTVRNRSCQ